MSVIRAVMVFETDGRTTTYRDEIRVQRFPFLPNPNAAQPTCHLEGPRPQGRRAAHGNRLCVEPTRDLIRH